MATRTATRAKGNGHVEDGKEQVRKIVLPTIDARRVTIRLEGLEPMITCRFAEKARQEIAQKQQGRAATRKAPKDPVALYRGASTWCPAWRTSRTERRASISCRAATSSSAR